MPEAPAMQADLWNVTLLMIVSEEKSRFRHPDFFENLLHSGPLIVSGFLVMLACFVCMLLLNQPRLKRHSDLLVLLPTVIGSAIAAFTLNSTRVIIESVGDITQDIIFRRWEFSIQIILIGIIASALCLLTARFRNRRAQSHS